MIIVSVLWLAELAPVDLSPIKKNIELALEEATRSEEILSYTQTSRRFSSVVTILGDPRISAIAEEDIPTFTSL